MSMPVNNKPSTYILDEIDSAQMLYKKGIYNAVRNDVEIFPVSGKSIGRLSKTINKV